MRKIGHFLNQPYPFYANTRQAWQLVIVISIFISAFCFIFKPFGIYAQPRNIRDYVALGFGGVTFLSSAFNMVLLPIIFPKLFADAEWKVYKELIWVGWMIFSIATLNYFYSGFFYEFDFEWVTFWRVQLLTFIIAVGPGIGVIFFKQIYLYKRNLQEVDHLNQILKSSSLKEWDEFVVLTSTNKGEQIKLDHRYISCIEAAGNYIEIFYTEGETEKKTLLRNKISNIEEQVSRFPILQRCHRTYIVNIKKVSYLEGNSQGYKLHLLGTTKIVPVARSYSGNIKKMIEAVFDDPPSVL